jgi:hypothetical protein
MKLLVQKSLKSELQLKSYKVFKIPGVRLERLFKTEGEIGIDKNDRGLSASFLIFAGN